MGERGKEHDIFDPGVSEEQRKSAESMLGGLELSTFVEQRSFDDEFRPAVLIPLDGSDPIEVAVSPVIEAEAGPERVILTDRSMKAMARVQLVFRRAGQQYKLVGGLTETRPGRRSEDRSAEPPVQVARFYERKA